MSSEPTIALLRHLESPSGWWRDTAQREIILRDDRDTVEPHLRAIAKFADSPNARFHAMWTLEGMAATDLDLLAHMAKDNEARIRRAAVQVAEPRLGAGEVFDAVARPLANDNDPHVARQLILSLGLVRDHPDGVELIQQIARRQAAVPGVQLATTLSLWGRKDLPLVKEILEGNAFDPATTVAWKNMLGNWDRGIQFLDDMSNDEKKRITSGETQYFASCITCHGADGKGIAIAGSEMMLAPSLVDSARVKGDPNKLIAVLLHGLMGPIDGKSYQAGFMAPAHALGITREDRLSELITYLRFVHGEGASSVSKEDVAKTKKMHGDRAGPWTDDELKALPE
jgi:mono/diheme cytochrome c family protein